MISSNYGILAILRFENKIFGTAGPKFLVSYCIYVASAGTDVTADHRASRVHLPLGGLKQQKNQAEGGPAAQLDFCHYIVKAMLKRHFLCCLMLSTK